MKTIKFISKFTSVALLVGGFTAFASAQTGPVVDTDTTSSKLEMTALVETSLQLNISTGTNGAAVSGNNATGLFSVDLGRVNGLGNSTPSSNVTKTSVTGGTMYSTPINLTPVYSGFGAETASVEVTAGGSNDDDIAFEGANVLSLAVISNVPKGAFTGAASNSNNERIVGFKIADNELAGAKTATFIYTVTMNVD